MTTDESEGIDYDAPVRRAVRTLRQGEGVQVDGIEVVNESGPRVRLAFVAPRDVRIGPVRRADRRQEGGNQ
jgi:hypothetical protein